MSDHPLVPTTNAADVVRVEKAPEVSFDRWLGAVVAGDRCGDKGALEFARAQKSVVTTSTGVLVPGAIAVGSEELLPRPTCALVPGIEVRCEQVDGQSILGLMRLRWMPHTK